MEGGNISVTSRSQCIMWKVLSCRLSHLILKAICQVIWQDAWHVHRASGPPAMILFERNHSDTSLQYVATWRLCVAVLTQARILTPAGALLASWSWASPSDSTYLSPHQSQTRTSNVTVRLRGVWYTMFGKRKEGFVFLFLWVKTTLFSACRITDPVLQMMYPTLEKARKLLKVILLENGMSGVT